MPQTNFCRDIRQFGDAEGWRGNLRETYGVSYAALDFRFARLRQGSVLSGHAWANTGKIISLIPSLDLEKQQPGIAAAAWARNRVAENFRPSRIPTGYINRVAAQIRELSYREVAVVKREWEPISLTSILPEIRHKGDADLFICGFDRGQQKIYFEIALLSVEKLAA